MHQRGQATIEAIALTAAVALLALALGVGLARPGLATRLGRSVAAAIDGALMSEPMVARALPAELALFDEALAVDTPDDLRPSLRDLRIALRARLGDEASTTLLDRLLAERADLFLPASRAGAVSEYADVPARTIAERDLAPARPGAAAWVERASTGRTVRVVGAADEDAYLAEALDGDRTALALDVAGLALPFVPGDGAKGLLEAGIPIASHGRTALALLTEHGEIPPGAREGDVVVTWRAERRHREADGRVGPPFGVAHIVVLRAGRTIAHGLVPAPVGRTTDDGH